MKRTSRTGSTLLELMMLVSATSVMLVLIIGFIHRTLDWSKEITQINDELRTSQQITNRFHQDIHDASDVQWIDESVLVITTREMKTIRYEIHGNSIVRSAAEPAADGATATPDKFPRESFQFPEDRVLKILSPIEKKCFSLHLYQTAIDFDKPKELWRVESYWLPPTTGANS